MIIISSLFLFFCTWSVFSYSVVHGRVGVGSGEQDWGYVTVRPGAHMFWWLYYTTNKDVKSFSEKPLIIWIQGGPGRSGTGVGNFMEIGPYDMNMNPRNHTWVKDYNVLFIDNPVGTGFSYVDDSNSYARTNAQIAQDLLSLMKAFYENIPEFRNVPVYISSQSYGGKMAVEFALIWNEAEKSGLIESKLKGVSLGDPSISPIDSVLTWAPFLLQTGMVDSQGFEEIQKSALKIKEAVDSGQWSLANDLKLETVLLADNLTYSIHFDNILVKSPIKELNKYEELEKMMINKVKTALNLDAKYKVHNFEVLDILSEDNMKPVTNIVERLLDETDLKVFVYTGQLDLIVDTPGTLKWVENLKWKNAEKWYTSKRLPVIVDDIVEGYVKSFDKFSFYWVKRAGHMVPVDNPIATEVIIKDLTKS